MKKLLCIFASAALLGACEQRTDVVAPTTTSSPVEKKETNTTIVESDHGEDEGNDQHNDHHDDAFDEQHHYDHDFQSEPVVLPAF